MGTTGGSIPFFRRAGLSLILLGLIPMGVRAGDDSVRIALDKTLPARKEYMGCDIFARALYKRLTQAGGEAHYIIYNWQSMDAGWLCHAIVVFRDGRGQYLGMDQNRNMPLLLPGKTPAEWIQWFNGPGAVQLVSSVTDKKLAGQFADLSRVPTGKRKAEKPKAGRGKVGRR